MSIWSSIILLLVGAAVGFVPTFLNERRKEVYQLKTRWDQPLFELSKEFAAAMRLLRHLCQRYDRVEKEEDKPEWRKRIDEAHAKLRAVVEQLRILANAQTYRAGGTRTTARLLASRAEYGRIT